MADLELLKKSLFEIEIAFGDVFIKTKDIPYDEAWKLVTDLVAKYPENEDLKSAFGNGSMFGFSGYSHGKFQYKVYGYPKPVPLAAKDSEEFLCPRRNEGVPAFMEGKKDKWRMQGADPCCSYCGSIQPARLFELIEKHGIGIMSATDKNYKWYVNQPNVPNASYGAIKLYTPHLSKEDVDKLNEIMRSSRAGSSTPSAQA